MKTRTFLIGMIIALFLTGGAYAMMGGKSGPGMGGGHMRGGGMGGGHMGSGMGHGMVGAGGMISGMMENTISQGYLDILNPIGNATEAQAAIQAFIDASNSSLKISELWEYETAYKAELSDTTGAKAFDLVVDKFTGVVMPEMGMSMMLNASYGEGMYKTPPFEENLTLTPDQAKGYAQSFVEKNDLGYALKSPETYPGYYKFHTTTTPDGKFGMDMMVNGYNGGIWMNTLLGLPVSK